MVYKPLREGSLTKLFGWNIFIDLFLSECVSVTKWINKRVLIWRLPPALCKYIFIAYVCSKLLRRSANGINICRNFMSTSRNFMKNSNTLFLNGIPPSDNKEHYLDCSILLAGFKSIAEIEYLVSKLAKF